MSVWLTREQAVSMREQARDAALPLLRAAYPDWTESRLRALLAATERDWGLGPVLAADALAAASEHVLKAWELRPTVGALVLLRNDGAWTPLFVQDGRIARRIAGRSGLAIDLGPVDV